MAQLEAYLSRYHPKIKVSLAFKRNNRDCRGHGTISCPDQSTADKLLSCEHSYNGRRIIIERIKSPEEIARKYEDLQARKLKIIIPLPTTYRWTNSNFVQHFAQFGPLESAHLKEEPVRYYQEEVLMGNVTFISGDVATQVVQSKDQEEWGYWAIRGFELSQKTRVTNSSARHQSPVLPSSNPARSQDRQCPQNSSSRRTTHRRK